MLQPPYLGLLFIYHIPIHRSSQFSLTFEVISFKNAVECSYNQLVQSNALKNCEVKRLNKYLCLVAIAIVTIIFMHSLYPEAKSLAS